MKANGLWKLAVRTWRRMGILYLAVVIIGAFSMTAAFNALFTLQEEKSEPSQLTVTAENITDEALVEIEKIDGVLDVTGVIDVTATLKIGEWKSELMIQGVRPEWIKGTYVEGTAITEQTSMPYIVLNEAAMHSFTDENGKKMNEDDTFNWEETASLDGEKPLPAKVCGIIQDDSEEPKAYMSLSQAKNTLLHMGSIPAYSSALVQTRDMGSEEQVLDQLASLGLMGTPTNPEQQEEWKRKEMELTYLLVMGLLSLLCSSALAGKNIALDRSIHKAEYEQLGYMGLEKRQISGICLRRHIFCTAVGSALGIIISLSVPSFLLEELRESSIFASKIYLLTYIIVLGIYIVPCLFFRNWKPETLRAIG